MAEARRQKPTPPDRLPPEVEANMIETFQQFADIAQLIGDEAGAIRWLEDAEVVKQKGRERDKGKK